VITLPMGVLGDEIDACTTRSQELVEQRVALIEQIDAAHVELHQAEQSDAVALAHAVRSGGEDPGVERTEAAKAVVAALERQINGLDAAQQSLKADVASKLLDNAPDLLHDLANRGEVARADRIVALDQLRAADSEGATVASLTSYIERLREISNADAPLPSYEPRESKIRVADMKRSADRIPTQRLLDVLSDAFSEPLAGAGADLRHIAEQAGCPCIGVRVVTTGACQVPSQHGPRSKPGNLEELGLSRVEWHRTRNWAALLIATETLADRGVEDVVREFSPGIAQMFLGASRQVFVDDERTRKAFDVARGTRQPDVDKRQIDENVDRVRDPQPPPGQEHLVRERAERRAHEREQQTA
jgi:hypothetical protein